MKSQKSEPLLGVMAIVYHVLFSVDANLTVYSNNTSSVKICSNLQQKKQTITGENIVRHRFHRISAVNDLNAYLNYKQYTLPSLALDLVLYAMSTVTRCTINVYYYTQNKLKT